MPSVSREQGGSCTKPSKELVQVLAVDSALIKAERQERVDYAYKFSRMETLTPLTSDDESMLLTVSLSIPLLDRLSDPSKSSPIVAGSYRTKKVSRCRSLAGRCHIKAKLMGFPEEARPRKTDREEPHLIDLPFDFPLW